MAYMKSLLDKLPEPFRTKALSNDETGEYFVPSSFTVSKAVDKAFSWSNTEEGVSYWYKIFGVATRIDSLITQDEYSL